MKTALLISCEHYSNEVPAGLEFLFKGNTAVLHTHRAYDIGAAGMFDALKSLASFSHKADRSRLLIELNRSLHHPKVFSEFTKHISEKEKETLLAYYLSYRSRVKKAIEKEIEKGNKVLHIGVHSFTPVLNGIKRKADIGLLYDPARKWEKSFSVAWKQQLIKENESLKIRFNYPYLGKADGFTTSLRKEFNAAQYAGIELEVNQAFFMKDMNAPLIKQIKDSLAAVLS